MLLEGEDKPLAPARLEPLSPTLARLTISEGRYHQVRRMFAAVGNHVLALHRNRIGGLELPETLEPGAWRLIGPPDVAAIFAPADA
jgi:16S rRNA pseudouridine516 synthase